MEFEITKGNGKVKEFYANGKLLFEGEYVNGERWNGKGYNSNNEIEFDTKGNEKVKEYYSNGKLKYEGDYLNRKRHGKGKEYDLFNGQLKFEGEFLNGKKWNGK